ncbi:MAG: hypothetical protein V4456_09540 [Bacteroidota bacterium]
MTIYQKIGIAIVLLGAAMFILGVSMFSYTGAINPFINDMAKLSFEYFAPAIIIGFVLILVGKPKA